MLSSTSPHHRQRVNSAKTVPFPSQQLFILALCRICEPIAFMSIFPYVYYMILSFDITSNTRQIAIYVGMVTSAFAFAEFSSGVVWGRISDKVGRKPVLLAGLAGTALSMLVFGFAPSLPVAVLGRALGGLLNGNMGVLQTTVAEIVTVKEHQPRAYSIMPFVWCLGSILGPALGGALAQPCENYPIFFPRGTVFDHYPFLLPNLVCAVVLAFGVMIGILFLEETHGDKKCRRDKGIEAGRWLLSHLGYKQPLVFAEKSAEVNLDDYENLLEEEAPPGYRTTEGSPRISSSRCQSPGAARTNSKFSGRRVLSKPRGVKKAFTKQVVLNILGFGLLAYHSISFDQLMPVFLSEPISHEPPSLPFHITGGFAFSTKKIGFMLSVQGAYSMLAQIFIFPFAARHFGTLKTFRFVVMTWPLLYLVVPYVVLLPQWLQVPGVYFCLIWKITSHVLAFPSNAILLTNSAPSLLVLGVINGTAASTASLARACGPTVTGILHAWGLEMGSTGLAWWASGIISLIGALESMWLEEVRGRMDEPDVQDEEELPEEALIDPMALDAAINAAGDLPQPFGQADYELHKSDSKVSIT
ncbi:hypothetical protein ABVK25_002225 [Lepraria finkii]|uniref:Major facilitator superfamily (MFS) profile domain-containing protein n=1 Tax=Lepraria finkii TaxID=1340010 RepID=A0ABR4BMK9_9LECA